MTPKSLLRHKRVVSKLEEFTGDGHFHRVLSDHAETEPNEAIKLAKDDKIRRVILCTGKVYYDLFEEREKRGIDDVYLLRVEQLYPLPLKALVSALSRFKKADVVWCQEEPKNMGAWTFVEPYLEWVLAQAAGKSKRVRYVGRPASAATAAGMMSVIWPAQSLPRRGLRKLKISLPSGLRLQNADRSSRLSLQIEPLKRRM